MSPQDFSLQNPRQLPYKEACEKLIKAFNLEEITVEEKRTNAAAYSVIEDAARAAIKVTSGGDIDDPIEWHRFDNALRNFAQMQEHAVGLIPDHTLVRVLLNFYLEISGVDMSTITLTVSETATAAQYLNKFLRLKQISWEVSQSVLFFFIVESCNPAVQGLISMHNYDPSEALRDGLHTSMLTRSSANIAEFCLLTGLGPVEARRHNAQNDLPGAVASAFAETYDLNDAEYAVKCIQARLFPYASDEEGIKKALLKNRTAEGLVEAEKMYLVGFFRTVTQCSSDEQAITYLSANNWVMETATQSYRNWALTRGPLDDIELPDAATPPSLEIAVISLVLAYEKSLPTYSVKDHLLIDMIRRFKAGHFNTELQLSKLHAQLDFRLKSSELAMQIVRKLELWKGAAVHISAWDLRDGTYRQEQLAILGQIQQNTNWFKPKKNNQGQYYKKPLMYVARAMDMQGYHGKQVLEQIAKVNDMMLRDGTMESGSM